MKGNKVGWLIFAVLLALVIITVFTILYQKTDFAKEFVKGFMWWWDGLRHWHWE